MNDNSNSLIGMKIVYFLINTSYTVNPYHCNVGVFINNFSNFGKLFFHIGTPDILDSILISSGDGHFHHHVLVISGCLSMPSHIKTCKLDKAFRCCNILWKVLDNSLDEKPCCNNYCVKLEQGHEI